MEFDYGSFLPILRYQQNFYNIYSNITNQEKICKNVEFFTLSENIKINSTVELVKFENKSPIIQHTYNYFNIYCFINFYLSK